MTDETFQLTPHDVRAQEFQRVLRGFDPVQVEDFKTRLAEEIDRLMRQRASTDERLRGMVEQLKSYRDRERALNDALVAAQQLRADAQASTEREVEVTLREARLQADTIIQEARQEAERIRAGLEAAERQYASYLGSFRALLERQLAEVASLEKRASAGGDDA